MYASPYVDLGSWAHTGTPLSVLSCSGQVPHSMEERQMQHSLTYMPHRNRRITGRWGYLFSPRVLPLCSTQGVSQRSDPSAPTASRRLHGAAVAEDDKPAIGRVRRGLQTLFHATRKASSAAEGLLVAAHRFAPILQPLNAARAGEGSWRLRTIVAPVAECVHIAKAIVR